MKKQLMVLAVFLSCGVAALGADAWGLKRGTPTLKSASVLAFGPDDVLFIGDTKAAAIVAVATGDSEGDPGAVSYDIADLPKAIADVVGRSVTVSDLVANPATGTVFVGCDSDEGPAIVRVDAAGKISELKLADVRHSSVGLSDAPEDRVTGQGRRRRNQRADAITDLAFFEGKLLVSGLRTVGSPSSIREISFPFAKADQGVGVQIYHAAHGREEDYSAMRTFVPLMVDGEPSLLGAYVCTPLVKIPLNSVASGTETVKATTVAELGNRNRPLDMISYEKGDTRYLLLSNSARGVMKITTAGLQNNDGLTEPVRGGGQAGQPYETIEDLEGVVQMTQLNDTHAVVLIDQNGSQHLKSIMLP